MSLDNQYRDGVPYTQRVSCQAFAGFALQDVWRGGYSALMPCSARTVQFLSNPAVLSAWFRRAPCRRRLRRAAFGRWVWSPPAGRRFHGSASRGPKRRLVDARRSAFWQAFYRASRVPDLCIPPPPPWFPSLRLSALRGRIRTLWRRWLLAKRLDRLWLALD